MVPPPQQPMAGASALQRQQYLADRFGGSVSGALALARLLDPGLPADWRAVAGQWVTALELPPRPLVLGICGGQGSGKSTLARAVVGACQARGVRAAAVSLDDFYLTRSDRAALASAVHPLLATRGVPGTHDVPLLRSTLETLSDARVLLPVFSKAMDDRLPRDQWRSVSGPLQVLVLEGWCVGAVPEPEAALLAAVNALETREDPAGDYRRYVNAALAETYHPLWQRLHQWLYLATPGMAALEQWRWQQEQQLPPSARMTRPQLRRFMAHYQRLTQWQARSAPERADWTLHLGADHRLQLG